MGVVFSYLATCFMYLGEFTSTLFLALGEIGSMFSRGIFGVIVVICDVLAACMCCFRVPFQDRPDRDGYTYSTLAFTRGVPVLDLRKVSRLSMKDITAATKERDTLDRDTCSGMSQSPGGIVSRKFGSKRLRRPKDFIADDIKRTSITSI